MSESLRPTMEEVAAAHLRVVLDRRLGKATNPVVDEIARIAPDDIGHGDASMPHGASQPLQVPEAHLLPDAVVAFVDNELSPVAHNHATRHIARCRLCATEVAIQRHARTLSTMAPESRLDERPGLQDLTPRQRRVLQIVADSLDRSGYPPSVREIGEQLGLASTSSVTRLLRALERKGFLRRDPSLPRAIGIPVLDEELLDRPPRA